MEISLWLLKTFYLKLDVRTSSFPSDHTGRTKQTRRSYAAPRVIHANAVNFKADFNQTTQGSKIYLIGTGTDLFIRQIPQINIKRG